MSCMAVFYGLLGVFGVVVWFSLSAETLASVSSASAQLKLAETRNAAVKLADASNSQPVVQTDGMAVPKNPSPKTDSGSIPPLIASAGGQGSYKTPYEVYLAIFTVVLGVAFIGLFCFVHKYAGANVSFSRNYIILTVIFSALFLIVAGYSERQTAPVFGLLGTIIGYMFGAAAGGSQAKPANPVKDVHPAPSQDGKPQDGS